MTACDQGRHSNIDFELSRPQDILKKVLRRMRTSDLFRGPGQGAGTDHNSDCLG
jgi:hypothetical protein